VPAVCPIQDAMDGPSSGYHVHSSLQRPAPHVSIALHYITLHYITLHYITLHYITLHYITLHYITLHLFNGQACARNHAS
jgi:hypothetical protein